MAEKEIVLLKEQLEKLNEKKFDLEAWKNQTLIFLERIFGKENSKIYSIKNLHYDYSSWNLRDTAAAGKSKDKDPIKMQAYEIVSAAITELEKLGLPQDIKESKKVWALLQDELTGKQIKDLESLIRSESSDKVEKIGNIIEKMGTENMSSVIAKLLID